MSLVKLTLRIQPENLEQFKLQAQKEGFTSLAEWIRVKLNEALEADGGQGRPVLSEEEKRLVKLKRGFEKDVDYFYAQDQGELCPGSDQPFPYNGEFGKYPGALCTVCSRQMWGLREGENVVVRRHKDGRQTVGDLEKVDSEITISLTKKEERDEKRRSRK